VSAPVAPVRWNVARFGAGRSFDDRQVDFDVHGGERTATVIERSALTSGESMTGPCVVQEEASTTVVLPGQTVVADELGNLVITEAP
jgi:N-methylhydantoinase A/oxoprolinase/acetone carboxylase beta subunit